MIKRCFNSINNWICKTDNQRIIVASVCGAIIGNGFGLKMGMAIIAVLVLNIMWSRN